MPFLLPVMYLYPRLAAAVSDLRLHVSVETDRDSLPGLCGRVGINIDSVGGRMMSGGAEVTAGPAAS